MQKNIVYLDRRGVSGIFCFLLSTVKSKLKAKFYPKFFGSDWLRQEKNKINKQIIISRLIDFDLILLRILRIV